MGLRTKLIILAPEEQNSDRRKTGDNISPVTIQTDIKYL